MQAERILMTRRQCAVYKIPPASSSRGHKAEDWKGNKILLGFIEVFSLGKEGGVYRILNPDLSLFVESKFTTDWEKYVDRCYDSTRYFAITLINPTGQKVYVGLGFEDRNDAFDFMGSFQKYKEEIEIQENPDKYLGKMEDRDYSLKSGEKISLSFGATTGIGGSTASRPAPAAASKGLLPPPPRKLAPPPKAKASSGFPAPPSQAATTAMPSYTMPFSKTQTVAPNPSVPSHPDPFKPPATSAGSGESGWGDGFSFSQPAASSVPTQPAPAPSGSSGTGNLIDLE